MKATHTTTPTSNILIPSPSHLSPMHSSQSSFTSSEADLLGGKTIHHQASPVKTFVNKDVMKISTLSPPISTNSLDSLSMPPLKKIKLGLGRSGKWETKPTSILSTEASPVKKTNQEEEEDVPVDLKSRCVIQLEEMSAEVINSFKATASEIYFLSDPLNDYIDLHSWLKKPNTLLEEYITKMASRHDLVIKDILNEEAKGFITLTGTLPTITPVVISKTLPLAVSAYKQQLTFAASNMVQSFPEKHNLPYKNSTNLVPGGIPLSTTTATTTVDSPAIFNVDTTPAPINNDSASSLLPNKQEAAVELAKQEAKVMRRIVELRRRGLWSHKRLPKVLEPNRHKSHWDHLLSEVQWMATDFAEERRWKITASSKMSKAVKRGIEKRTAIDTNNNDKDSNSMKLAKSVACIINQHWYHASKTSLHVDDIWEEEMLGGVSGDGSKLIGGGRRDEEENNDDVVKNNVDDDEDDVIMNTMFDDSPMHVLKEIYGEDEDLMGGVYAESEGWQGDADEKKKQESFKYDSIGQLMQAVKQLQDSIDQSEKNINDQSEEVTSVQSKFKQMKPFITAESFKILDHLEQCRQHNLPSILINKQPSLHQQPLGYTMAVLVSIHLAQKCAEGRHLVVCGEMQMAMWKWTMRQASLTAEVLEEGPCCQNAEHLLKKSTSIITASLPSNNINWHTLVLCRQQAGDALPPHKHLICLSPDYYDVTNLVQGGFNDEDSRLQLEKLLSKDVACKMQPITHVSTKHVTCRLSANQEQRYKEILKDAKNSKWNQIQMYVNRLRRISSCFSWYHHQHNQALKALSEAFSVPIDEFKPNSLNFLLLLLSRIEDDGNKQKHEDVTQNYDDVNESFKRVLKVLIDNADKFDEDDGDVDGGGEKDNETKSNHDKKDHNIKDNDKKDDSNDGKKDDNNDSKDNNAKIVANNKDCGNGDWGDDGDGGSDGGKRLIKVLLTEEFKGHLKRITPKVAKALDQYSTSQIESINNKNNKNNNGNKKNNKENNSKDNNEKSNVNGGGEDEEKDDNNGEKNDEDGGLRVIKQVLAVMKEAKKHEDGVISALKFLVINNKSQLADDANYSNKWIIINDKPFLLAPQLQHTCRCHVIKPNYHTCKRKKVIGAFNNSSQVGGVAKDDIMKISCLLLTKESMLEVLKEGMLVVAGNIVVLQDVAGSKEGRGKKEGKKQQVGGRDKGVVTQLLKQMTAVCLEECCVYSLTYSGTLEHRMLIERLSAGDYDVLNSSQNSFHHFYDGQLQQSNMQQEPDNDLEVFYAVWRRVVDAVKKKKIDTYVKRVLTRGDMEQVMSRKRKYDDEEEDDDDPCNILTYCVDHDNPQTFVSDLTGELMPVWAPPTPPQEDDFYLDECLLHHYDVSAMPESQLPPVYVRRKKKKSHRVDGRLLNKASHHSNLKLHSTSLQRPRSLFEKSSVPPATSFINVFSNPNAVNMGYHYDRDGRLVNKLGLPLGRPAPKSPTLQTYTKPPICESEHSSDWLVHEDWAVLQAYQMHHESPTPSFLYQQTPMRHPNWHLVADVVNTFSRTYRSARQCRTRFEKTILVRESGKNVNDVNALRNKIKRSNKGIYKSKNSKPMKTVQLYAQDNNRAITSQFNLKFDLIKALAEKRKMESRSSVPSLSCKMDKQQQLTLMSDHSINYDSPFTSCQVINARIDRLSREQREKRNADKPNQSQQQQQQPQVQQASNNTADNTTNTHQQQQATPSKILPISLANMFSNSQLRMVQQTQHNNTPSQLVIQPSLQQQQQVILQAAGQSQLLVTASSVYDNRTQQPQQQISIGKVPLVSSIGSSGNLKSLSFVVNPSTSSQQSAAYVAKTNPVNSAVALVPTSGNNFKGIRNATACNTKLLANTTNINIPNLMNQVSGNKVSFRGSPSIQLNQRFKPTTIQQQFIQQQLVNNSSGNMAKLNNIITLATTPLNSSQSFHVKNAQVVLKQRSATPVQQTSNNTNRIPSIATNNQAFQLTHLQLPPKSNLIEQLQQQQTLPSNISALIRTNPTTSSIQIAGKSFFNGKMISQPANVSIWQQQQQRQPVKKTTIATINLQNKPNRTAIVGLSKNTSITPSVIYHPSQKLFVQSKQVPQAQNTSTVLPRTLPTTSANDSNSGA